jgi:hypothetical protein
MYENRIMKSTKPVKRRRGVVIKRLNFIKVCYMHGNVTMKPLMLIQKEKYVT